MDQKEFSRPVGLSQMHITDAFWAEEMELVRTEVIPYQWRALNDEVPGAAKSYCMRNYRLAGEKLRAQKEGKTFPVWPVDQIEYTDEDGTQNRHYGFVFQDTDFTKWVEAVAYSLQQHSDPELEKLADDAIEVVCQAQREDGYLDTFYLLNDESKIFTNLRWNHELYCFGHLAEGAAAYYQATGKDRLLQAACRFADYIASRLGAEEGKKRGYPGHEIAEMALVRLYEVTGEKRYLDLACYFLEERGKRPYYFDQEQGIRTPDDRLNYEYFQAHLPVREQDEAAGHAVRAVYLYSGMADAARLTGDETMYAACERLWDNIVNKKMYVTGGIGATHIGEAFSFAYDLPNQTAYAETCAAIGLVFFARRMLEIHANAKYADVMELALYNGMLSGMSLDGKSFFYVNPLEVLPEACHKDERVAHVKPVRQKWFGCACCPPNLARTISSIGSYAFTEKEDTLFLHLYMGADLKVNGSSVSITSGFPWNGEVCVEIREDMKEDYCIALRIPGWYQAEPAVIPGADVLVETSDAALWARDGYLYLKKQWKKGDQIRLNFPMKLRALIASTKVREDIGRTALRRGPVVYCLEEADNGKELHLLETQLPLQAAESVVTEMDRTFVRVDVKGRRRQPLRTDALYADYETPQYTPAVLRYIPYFLWCNRGEGEMRVWSTYYEA